MTSKSITLRYFNWLARACFRKNVYSFSLLLLFYIPDIKNQNDQNAKILQPLDAAFREPPKFYSFVRDINDTRFPTSEASTPDDIDYGSDGLQTPSTDIDMIEVVSALKNLECNKENEAIHKTPSFTTKKWYQGVVVKPVAFRSTTKRGFHLQN